MNKFYIDIDFENDIVEEAEVNPEVYDIIVKALIKDLEESKDGKRN